MSVLPPLSKAVAAPSAKAWGGPSFPTPPLSAAAADAAAPAAAAATPAAPAAAAAPFAGWAPPPLGPFAQGPFPMPQGGLSPDALGAPPPPPQLEVVNQEIAALMDLVSKCVVSRGSDDGLGGCLLLSVSPSILFFWGQGSL